MTKIKDEYDEDSGDDEDDDIESKYNGDDDDDEDSDEAEDDKKTLFKNKHLPFVLAISTDRGALSPVRTCKT